MEAFRERFITAELLSYKCVLFEEATEEWYAQWIGQRAIVCVKLSNSHISWKSIENDAPSITQTSGSKFRELPHRNYTSQLDNLDNIEDDQLEVEWLTWHRDYAYNKMWGDSRTSKLNAINVNCKFLRIN